MSVENYLLFLFFSFYYPFPQRKVHFAQYFTLSITVENDVCVLEVCFHRAHLKG